ncbi:MAG: hemerythrin [Tistrella sp.]|uniref:Hemerythrin domain-containing protein n=1 Tax=Tistrella mobilis TaxID=171437 RepID=A0A162L3U1_9PROT|nr:hemerythrin domain-containing protein [Tistrella mobilis]KYO53159.1 hypothetical protein AUP44_04045 [Tistrella mobilis]MBA78003.1 hemerythrin [Tistrella sp.]HAE50182.1 hemerythrin domain-containing protein [Tistrella mobilis]
METDRIALGALTEGLPPTLFLSPLDRIFADHFRQRALFRSLDRIAAGPEVEPALITAVIGFLATEVEPHWTDEEDDLFPLLRARARPEDRIRRLLARLARDHAAARSARVAIIRGLPDPATRRDPAFREMLTGFAADERRHLCLENAVVLPIARARLGHQDLMVLGQRMAARRGVPIAMTEYVT